MNSQRTRDPDATRAAILEAAEEIFLEKGFGATPISAIAKRAGITKSLIHHYFGSKDGLWQEVKFIRFMQYAEIQLKMLQEGKPSLELLRNSLLTYFRFLKDNPQVIRIMAWMFLEQDQSQACLDIDKQLIEIGVKTLQEAQTQGLLRKDMDARFILFTLIGLSHHWFQDREHFINDFGVEGLPADIDDAYFETMQNIVLEGILPR